MDFQEMESLKEQLQKVAEEKKKLEQTNEELMVVLWLLLQIQGLLKDSQQRESDLEKQLAETTTNPGTVSLLKTVFESGETIDTRSMSDLIKELEEK